MHNGIPRALPKGFTRIGGPTSTRPTFFASPRGGPSKKSSRSGEPPKKRFPPSDSPTPRFSDSPTHLYVYNQLIFNYLLVKLTALSVSPVNLPC
jgi:hypothetical protein